MALKPTIYKFEIHLSDLDRNLYETRNLTVAQHPSESVERMMARVLAYCLNYNERLEFTRGVSSTDEPDLWQHSLAGELEQWIEIGEPSLERLRKASRLCKDVSVYSINTKSEVWWQQIESDLSSIAIDVFRIPWIHLQQLADMTERTMTLSVSLSDAELYVSSDTDNLAIPIEPLKSNA